MSEASPATHTTPLTGWKYGSVGIPLPNTECQVRRYILCGSFVLFMSCVCHAYTSVTAVLSPTGKGLTS